MERYLAIVAQGIVKNLIVVDPTDTATINHFGGLLLPEGSQVAIGWTHDGANFSAPPVVAPTKSELDKMAKAEMDLAAIAAIPLILSYIAGKPDAPAAIVTASSLVESKKPK